MEQPIMSLDIREKELLEKANQKIGELIEIMINEEKGFSENVMCPHFLFGDGNHIDCDPNDEENDCTVCKEKFFDERQNNMRRAYLIRNLYEVFKIWIN